MLLCYPEVCGGCVTNAGLAALPGCPELRTLNLSQNPGISDRGLPPLTELRVLESLNLSATKVGTGGLLLLRQCASLTSLALYGCPVPPAHAALLHASLPRLLSLSIDGPS
jgi:hypothetical protein